MKSPLILVAVFLAVLPGLTPAAPQDKSPSKKEPLVDQVRKAIDKGVHYLRTQQHKGTGAWEDSGVKEPHPGGSTALVVLALLNAGVKSSDPAVTDGLDYLMKLQKPTTYVRSLQTMAFVEADIAAAREGRQFGKKFLEVVQRNADHFLKTRIPPTGPLQGWGYDRPELPGGKADNSNTQYALLGLYAAKLGGATINPDIWKAIRKCYEADQNDDGGWGYSEGGLGPFGKNSKLSMTTAGICGLLIAGMELNAGREVLLKDGTAQNCGVYDEGGKLALRRGLDWISGTNHDRFQLATPHATFYNLYGIERAGRLSGLRFFYSHDWYREGCEFLVKAQKNDGKWFLSSRWDTEEYHLINTAFALLFLSKGRTPVLISKLAHGRQPRSSLEQGFGNANDQDWNNDRNDLRHLVAHASKELFKRAPMAWQTFDMARALSIQEGAAVRLTDEEILEVASDLLQSPIVYITGHKSLMTGGERGGRRFTPQEEELLKKYVENGGFILAEACCGDPRFNKGFHKWVEEVFEQELEDLPADHPVWTANSGVKPGSFGLKGLRMGCKWVMIYSPQDLSCRWETGKPEDPQCALAFKMGLNIIAYATGNEPPRPRLSRVDLAVVKDDPPDIPPNVLKVGQLNHGGDWKLAPRAMSNVVVHLHKTIGVDVAVKWEEVNVGTRKALDYKFIYMHGRKEFKFAKEDLNELRFNLENGGLLFADACCGSKDFDAAFREFLHVLLPKHKLEPIPPSDRLFSKELNGTALTQDTIRGRTVNKGLVQAMPPLLKGVKIDGRWAVIYSKYDIGCALERHQSADCLGYTPESALRIASAAVLYQLRPDLKGH